MNRENRRKVEKKKVKIGREDGAKLFFHTVIKSFEAGYDDILIDYTRPDGSDGKLRMQITDVTGQEIQPKKGEKSDGKRSSNSQS